ncbi:MAG: ABC transporter ATP-binding protein [Bacteroidia bacterium]
MEKTEMIIFKNLLKQYGDTRAVDVEELMIPAGQAMGLVGNNGAGKTTLFRMLLDLVRPTQGDVSSKGENVRHSESWKHYTGSYLDEHFLIDFLTAEEYFSFIAKINGLTEGDLQQFYARFDEIFNEEILGKRKYIRDLSQGNQKKVGIAAAIMPNPEVLVLDEPFANLDPSTQIRLKKLLRQLQEENRMTMLISSHDLIHVTEVCERIVVLERGRIVKDIYTSESTLQDLEAYFGA